MGTGQSGRVRRPKKDEVQERLIRAAERVFVARGFERATLEEIAETAGFSKGAVYSNYSSKDELFFTLMERHVDERIGVVERTLSGGGALEDKTRDAGALLVDLAKKDPEWQILFIEYWLRAVRNPDLRRRFALRRNALKAKIELLFEGSERGACSDLHLPPAVCALAVLALSNGLGIEGIIDPEAVPTGLYLAIMRKLIS